MSDTLQLNLVTHSEAGEKSVKKRKPLEEDEELDETKHEKKKTKKHGEIVKTVFFLLNGILNRFLFQLYGSFKLHFCLEIFLQMGLIPIFLPIFLFRCEASQ